MQLKTTVSVAPLVLLIVISLLSPGVSSQDGTDDAFMVDSKMLITGLDPLSASGSARLTFTGKAAVEMRHAVFNTSDADGNQWLDDDEAKEVMGRISGALVGKSFWGVFMTSAKNYSSRTPQWLVAHTTGMLDVDWTSEMDISFPMEFEGEGRAGTKTIETAQGAYDAFAGAVADAVGYAYEGHMQLDHRVTTVVLGSYTNPGFENGSMDALRTPLVEVFWYTYSGDVGGGAMAPDDIAFEGFSLKENQQIGFVVLFVGAFMIMRMPGKNFDKYEKLHPKKFRKFARPLISVRLSAYAITAALTLLYLFPFAFGFASANAIFYASYLYLLVPAAVVAEYFFSKSMYDRAALSIPEESVIEVKQAMLKPEEGEGEILCKVCYRPIEAGLDIYQCTCGMTMHVDCAEKAQKCPSCGEMLFAQQTRSIQCRSCGETFLYSGSDDAYSIQCTKCGAFQEDIKPGKNYLVVDDDPRNAFMMIRAINLSERPAMALTTSFPGKIRADYDLGQLPIKWFSDSSTDIDNLNPKDLDGDAMESISTFLMTTKSAGVLVDGIEALIEMNGFDKALAFVKRLNDLAAIHGSTIILSVNKKVLPEAQYKAISEEFDEIHDYS